MFSQYKKEDLGYQLQHNNLIMITEDSFNVKLEIVYATPNNFTKKQVYQNAICYIHKDAAECLKTAIALARQHGLGIKIYDAFRPRAAQEIFWETLPNPDYIGDPKIGSNHTRGIAVDLTLYDLATGKDLEMGEFDSFEEHSHHAWTDTEECPDKVRNNRKNLVEIMTKSGFETLATEWWHYQLKDPKQYPLIDGTFGIM